MKGIGIIIKGAYMKKIFFIFLLFFLGFESVYASSLYRQKYVLDDYTADTKVGYSVRKLRASYTGNCMRVRRASDNTEQDIGFVNNVLDTASLATFAAATDAYVTTWYDQTGNGSNMTQASSNAQPQIVASGVVITQNNKPSVYFDGTNDRLIVSNVALNTYITNFVVSRNITGNQFFIEHGQNVNTIDGYYLYGSGVAGIYATRRNSGNHAFTNPTGFGNDMCQVSSIYNGSLIIKKNLVALSTSVNLSLLPATARSNSSVTKNLYLGGRDASSALNSNVYVSELIIFNTALADIDINDLSNNQMKYYTISQ